MLAVLAIGSIQIFPSEVTYGHIAEASAAEEETKVASVSSFETEHIVRSYFNDTPIMIQIARCESNFRHTLADGSVLQGRIDPADTGVMQINKRYHDNTATTMNLDLDNIYDNMAYAKHLYETQGTRPWNASAPCWNPAIAMNI